MRSGPENEASQRVGDYTLLTRLGEGGMGIVHLARSRDGRRVALKVLRPQVVGDAEARSRLEREVNSLTRVRSPWVAEMIDADPWAEVPHVVTRYVPGLSLHETVRDHGPIAGRDLYWLAGCLAEGLAAVHAVGVLHRDVKPGNVLMEGRTPILIDFGLARIAEDVRITQTGWLLGTPGYLAPEILYGDEASPAADVHAWAATVVYAATGRAPYGRGPAMAIMDRTRRGQHDLTGIEQPLADVLATALDPDPLERPSLSELLAWLRPLSTRPELPRVAPPTGLFAAADPVVDEMTLPLVLATATPPPGGTKVLPDEVAPTDVLPTEVAPTEVAPTGWPEVYDPQQPFAPVVKPPWAQRLRIWVAVAAGASGVGAAFAAAPWLALTTVAVAVWLLRSGSLATSAVAERRRLRGVKWYDALRWITSSPWHLARAVTGTVVLVSWSVGIGLSAALICYAISVDVAVMMFAFGAVLGVALWSGPGSSRFRRPILRVLAPVSQQSLPWLLTCAGLLALAALLGVLVLAEGTSWAPWTNGPFGL